MFDLEMAINDYSGEVKSIIVDFTDVEHLKPAFGSTEAVIEHFMIMDRRVKGFYADYSDFIYDDYIFRRKQRISKWRINLIKNLPNYDTSALILKLNQEDLENFIKKTLSNRVYGFFLEFNSAVDFEEYKTAHGSLFKDNKFKNICYVKNYEPSTFKPDPFCNELYVDTSYIEKNGFYPKNN